MSTPAPTSSAPRPVPILIVLASAVLIYTMLETMLTPALPLIQHGVGASAVSITWVLTGVLLSGTVCTPLVGRLADTHDKRPILLSVLVIVCAGTLLSAVAGTIFWLAVGQVLQGAGLGLVSLGLGILRDTQRKEVVKRASGALVGASAASVILGLIITGIIVAHLRYNWVFLIPLALLVIITATAWKVIPSCPPSNRGKVDWTGAALLACGLFALLFGVSEAPSWGWTAPGFIVLEVLAVLLIITFLVVERRTEEPLIDLRLGGRAVVAACTMTFVIGYATTASFVIIPLIVAAPAMTGYGLAATASVTGMILIPGGVIGVVAAALTSRIERAVGSRAVMVVASVVTVASVAIMLLASHQPAILVTSSLLGGLGIGLGMTQAMNLVVAVVPADRVASVGGLLYVLRSVGGTLGGQISGSILAISLIRGTTLPNWSGFTSTFWIGSVVALAAIGVSLALPSRAVPAASTTASFV
ncbi:MAG TPA: MFS transporter [Pseudonocardiaceae bacterium]|jgi:MFS family permease|nr:MFS transporter [Pseudonocardiaceae bacterium]